VSLTARLELEGLTRRYPGVLACDRVDLRVEPGEIHAVLGENGAGKSTLMKIVYGAVRPDAGLIRWDGQPVEIASPADARRLGISMVYQHFSLFDTLTVAENIWLGLEPGLSLARLCERIDEVALAYGLDIDPRRPLHALSVGERQRVEIVRALLTAPRLLILDEPTSVLTPQAVDALFVTLRRLAAEGCSILYISHKLEEIRALCHRCTVLRAGRVTGVVDPREHDAAALSRMMIGAEPPPLDRRASAPGEHALRVRGLSLPATEVHGIDLRAVDLELRCGELVGIAGISGNGQQALMAALSGEDGRAPAGSITLFGQDISAASPRARRSAGLYSVPEERLGRGAVPTMSLAHNTLLTRELPSPLPGLLPLARMRSLAAHLIERFGVRAAGPRALARSLSGGNLQKFIVGREIDAAPRVLLVSQPTWGVDVGAAALIRAELLALRDAGCAVLVVSEELDELFAISDRLYVMARGRLSPALAAHHADPATVGSWMSGLWPGADAPEGVADAQA